MELKIDSSELWQLDYQMRQIGKRKLVPAATASAMNRALTHTKKNMGQITREEYAAKLKTIRDTLKFRRASKLTMTASIESKGPALPLADFPHTPTRQTKKRSQVKVQVKKSGGKKVVKVVPGAFVGRAKSGRKHIFRRVGLSRLPIEPLLTVAVPQMIENPRVMEEIEQKAIAMYEKRIHHELNYRLKKLQKKSEGKCSI